AHVVPAHAGDSLHAGAADSWSLSCGVLPLTDLSPALAYPPRGSQPEALRTGMRPLTLFGAASPGTCSPQQGSVRRTAPKRTVVRSGGTMLDAVPLRSERP